MPNPCSGRRGACSGFAPVLAQQHPEKVHSATGGSGMSEINERIEYVYESAARLAEGVLIDVCEECWPADDIARAAREWHRTRELMLLSRRWREHVRQVHVEADDD
jgi:hypothetical protein